MDVSPAAAHSIYTRRYIGADGNMCVTGVGEISDVDNPHGRAVGKVETHTADPTWLSCQYRPFHYADAHAIAAVIYFVNYAMQPPQWDVCFASDWAVRYNAASSVRNFDGVLEQFGCGNSYYATNAADAARSQTDSAWIWDWVLSGDPNGVYYHWLSW